MNFSSNIDELMKPFMKSFGKCDKRDISKEDYKLYQDSLNTLYKDIQESSDSVFNKGCFKHTILKRKENTKALASDTETIQRPPDFNSRYFPTDIQTYIKEHEEYQIVFSCGNVGGREITIYFSLFDENELNNVNTYIERVRMMYVWLNVCAKYASAYCSSTLEIYIYPTPFTKHLPNSATTVLGPEHVNTAFTFACAPQGQLIIFREEEWFKVFIHETFHAYGLDFARSDISNFKKKIAEVFHIDSDFDLYEAYTETWARIVNCILTSFNALENKKNKKLFMENVTFCIEMERMFAVYQCVKVLSFMGLHYRDLHNKNEKNTKGGSMPFRLYKENTHVFSYYVMTAIFLNDYEGFMVWCRKNNDNLLKFSSNEKGLESFFNYITSVFNCAPLHNSIDEMGRIMNQMSKTAATKTNSTRMSIIE